MGGYEPLGKLALESSELGLVHLADSLLQDTSIAPVCLAKNLFVELWYLFLGYDRLLQSLPDN